MIEVRRSEERGHANHGWLESHHTFSFASYQDPEHMGYRVLRVINEDRVAPGKGFGTHGHDNMEIISYVISGQLEHKDSMGNGSVINTGEFQIITAGTGITHSEFNPSESDETHFHQMWVLPEEQGLTPAYGQNNPELDSNLKLVATKDAEGETLRVNQDIKLYKAEFTARDKTTLPLANSRYGWLQIVSGEVEVNGEALKAGDGAALSEVENPLVSAKSDGEFLLFDLP